jgi:hypothetical protein
MLGEFFRPSHIFVLSHHHHYNNVSIILFKTLVLANLCQSLNYSKPILSHLILIINYRDRNIIDLRTTNLYNNFYELNWTVSDNARFTLRILPNDQPDRNRQLSANHLGIDG